MVGFSVELQAALLYFSSHHSLASTNDILKSMYQNEDETELKLNLFTIFTILCLIAAGLNSCQAFNRIDTYATAQAQNAGYETEVAAMTQVATAEVALINTTIEAHETTIAHVNGINQQLMRTLAIQVTPTPQIQVEAGVVDSTLQSDFEGRRLFVKTGVSTEINSSDGCVINPQFYFSETETRLYGTIKAFNIEPGVLMRAEWRKDGVPVWEDVWTVDQSYAEICIWFYLESADVPFTPGDWSVEMFADSFSLEGPMSFNIESASGTEDMMDEQSP